jgi:SAM-dependent methyltransferase
VRYAQFDYHPIPTGPATDPLQDWWAQHWEGRSGFREDLSDEPLWPTIRDSLREPGRVLEAGCGYGQWVAFLERLGHDVVGIDYVTSGLRAGKAADATLRLMRADFRALPFADATFDTVVSFGAIEHDVGGPDAALREFFRVLSPSGRLLCSVPCLNAERLATLPWAVVRDWLKCRPVLRRLAGKEEPFEFYEYYFTPRTYRASLERAGFAVDDMRTYGISTANTVALRVGAPLSRRFRFYNPHMMMAVCHRPG